MSGNDNRNQPRLIKEEWGAGRHACYAGFLTKEVFGPQSAVVVEFPDLEGSLPAVGDVTLKDRELDLPRFPEN